MKDKGHRRENDKDHRLEACATGLVDLAVVILSPVIVAGLTVIFLLGWWLEAVWRWLAGRER